MINIELKIGDRFSNAMEIARLFSKRISSMTSYFIISDIPKIRVNCVNEEKHEDGILKYTNEYFYTRKKWYETKHFDYEKFVNEYKKDEIDLLFIKSRKKVSWTSGSKTVCVYVGAFKFNEEESYNNNNTRVWDLIEDFDINDHIK